MASPTEPAQRVDQIDILRGLALFGVLLINLLGEFRVSIFQQFVATPPAAHALDRFLLTWIPLLVEMKAFAVFSLLFGIGLAAQYERLSTRNRASSPALPRLTRRLLILLVFGVLHLVFIWNGDILTEYAIAGLITLPFLRLNNRWLGVASLLFAILYIALPHLPLPLPALSMPWITQHLTQANIVFKTGSVSQIFLLQLHELPQLLPLHIYVLSRTLALFLFGAIAWRTGIARRPADHMPLLAGLGLGGILLGVVLTLLTSSLSPIQTTAFGQVQDIVNLIGELALSIGYAAATLFLVTTPAGRSLFRWAAPLGRMAFTNYILQSLVFSAIFYGWGFGGYGMNATPALLIGIAVYAAQVIASALWLRTHRFGPIEWLWRTLMYGHAQPMRRTF